MSSSIFRRVAALEEAVAGLRKELRQYDDYFVRHAARLNQHTRELREIHGTPTILSDDDDRPFDSTDWPDS